ncbi:MAG: glycosyltransferase family 4 protein [Patescibacteria group bacterium]|nr:glycosyltransferase family 4 protein [Patescibacteria group bacterium]
MKILIFSLAYLPFIGGAELAVKEITDRLRDIDFDLLTVNLDGKQQPVEEIGNITVYRLGLGKKAKYFFPYSAYNKAVELHQKNNYDVTWAIMANQGGIAAYRFKKHFPDVKYILTLQEGDSLKRIWSRTFFMRSLYKKIYGSADFIQPISSFLKYRAEKYGYQGNIKIVPNGVDLAKFQDEFSDVERNEFRSKLGILATDKVVITTSRLVYKNGIDNLIRAMRNVSAKLLICGDGGLEIKLKSLAQEIGVKDKILFLGHIDQTDLPKYLRSADVYARPSRSEGLGSAFLEAMAAGLPVIGTKVGGIPDFLIDGSNGLFCEVDNPSDLANKINLLLTDSALRQRLIEAGRAIVFKNYDWQQITDQMKEIFEKK